MSYQEFTMTLGDWILSKRLVPRKKVNAFAVSDIVLVIVVALLMMGVGKAMIVADNNELTNQNAAQLVAQANKKTDVKHPKPLPSTTVPSTVKPSVSTLASYTVSPTAPRYLIIPKLNVDARILSVGVNASGALETPDNVYDTAWYDQSAGPGQPGAMLIDGHISSWTAHGVFYGLNTLAPGDTIQVQRGDGVTFTYQVVKSQIYNASNVDMSAALSPIEPGNPGLNLISCSGDVIPGTSEFNERIVVFANLVS